MPRSSNRMAVLILAVVVAAIGLFLLTHQTAVSTEALPKVQGLNGVQVF